MVEEFVGLDDYYSLMYDVVNFESYQAEFLGETLYETYHPQSVIDIGCGPGIYLLPFMRHGCDVLGIDAEASMYDKYIPNNFQRVDLRLPWTPPHKFDLALCIEVAEHLKCEFSETLVHTCAACSDRIFFTAAIPGQGGTAHYCCRPTEEWINFFANEGYHVSDATEPLRAALLAQYRIGRATEWITRGMLFERNSRRDNMVEEFVGLDDYSFLGCEVMLSENQQAEFLAELLYEAYHPQSVIDIGCARGNYLVPFQRRGCEVLGIDGEPTNHFKYLPNDFQRVDLRLPWTPPHKFDLALCIEVAEHLKCEFSETIIHTCAGCADRIYFTSPAIDTIGSHLHYCCRPAEEWEAFFKKEGFHVNQALTQTIREKFQEKYNKGEAHDWTLRGTVFERN